jgi:hypothetical protein
LNAGRDAIAVRLERGQQAEALGIVLLERVREGLSREARRSFTASPLSFSRPRDNHHNSVYELKLARVERVFRAMIKTARIAGSSASETRPTMTDVNGVAPGELLIHSLISRRASDSDARSMAEFHRRRAEIEMEKALRAGRSSIAICHLELARLHRERRDALRARNTEPSRLLRRSCGTDKEA